MARTLSLRQVGFDGLFRRISHKEFFLDGLGRLKIAHCSNLAIGKNEIRFFLNKNIFRPQSPVFTAESTQKLYELSRAWN